MNISDMLSDKRITQAKLAEILGNGVITPKTRLRAHRIWHGQKPTQEDMGIIFEATKGILTANDFYGIEPIKTNGHRKKKT